MQVLINAASAKMGGALTYLKNVLHWAGRLAPEDQFLVYVPPSTRSQFEEKGGAPNVTLCAYPFASTRGTSRLFFDQAVVPKEIIEHQVDVLFSSTGFGTLASPCPEVLLVRNPTYFDTAFEAKYRELGRSLLRTRVRRWHSLLSIWGADLTLFPTQAMEDMVGVHLSQSETSTEVLHYGFDDDRFFSQVASDSQLARRIKEWKSDGYRVLLNVSTYAVHKNFETLIRAFSQLRGQGVPVKLVTTTSREQTSDTEEYDALRQQAAEWGVADDWHEAGYVPYRTLHEVYDAADLYVFPSFTESFGHSLVEAMAARLPIVAADMPVNREVCGTAGRFFSSFEPDECATLIMDLLHNDGERARLAEASKKRAQDFSWRKYTNQLLVLLRRVAAA